MIATCDPAVFIEEQRAGYTRYVNVDGLRWEVVNVCDHNRARIVDAVAAASSVAEVESLWVNYRALADRVRRIEKMLDTRGTSLWRRVIFRLDGWPSWWVVAVRPSWRPWRRWWMS